MQDIDFIRTTLSTMLEGKQQDTKQKILQSAAQYGKVRKFPVKLTDYNDVQIGKYFDYIEKLADMPEVFNQKEFEEMDIIEKVSSIMGDVTEITPEPDAGISNITDKIVVKMEHQNKFRDDLKCPYCKQMVYDNRNNKKSDKENIDLF